MSKPPVILFRSSLTPNEELSAAIDAGFECIFFRSYVQPGDLVVPRYSALPFYRELEADVNNLGGHLLNTCIEHCYVADLQSYVCDLGDLTPKTWYRLEDVPRDEGPFVLKGATNSKKHLWSTHCYAEDWAAMGDVHSLLIQDGLIGDQSIYVRKYLPLKRLGTALNGLPLTKEFRFFVCRGQVLSGGFYWDAFSEDIVLQGGDIPSVDEVPIPFLEEAVRRVADKVTFFAIDVAQTEKGNWIVIELNDGQMSGLSANKPEVLYKELYRCLQS